MYIYMSNSPFFFYTDGTKILLGDIVEGISDKKLGQIQNLSKSTRTITIRMDDGNKYGPQTYRDVVIPFNEKSGNYQLRNYTFYERSRPNIHNLRPLIGEAEEGVLRKLVAPPNAPPNASFKNTLTFFYQNGVAIHNGDIFTKISSSGKSNGKEFIITSQNKTQKTIRYSNQANRSIINIKNLKTPTEQNPNKFNDHVRNWMLVGRATPGKIMIGNSESKFQFRPMGANQAAAIGQGYSAAKVVGRANSP